MPIFRLAVLMLLALVLTGCGNMTKYTSVESMGDLNATPPLDAVAATAQYLAMRVPGVIASTAVVTDHEITTAVQVRGFDRLRLKKIREEVKAQIQSAYPNHQAFVTTDKKHFQQIKDLGPLAVTDPRAPDVISKISKINREIVAP
ncbi:YhcN/YlaJ family sporulation lipoprotein [Heliophilum fasciatum]|uniref:Sporulation lipoprotein YhcN/YlaJ n=1 Tax=Heliophilum fasciatum TaxID=35700 RepID=A0A4R2RNV2_9FIRM|nr:YhcN/YlaJ family sporulation lipoprotein [Heliophilum fasciatum]MCW2278001.1 hypothetical protein [Heliophilum fasciatum]TCP64379.1 sporulation lipoprotein YhcN/YlaJ [Heliophilum fasciatum]